MITLVPNPTGAPNLGQGVVGTVRCLDTTKRDDIDEALVVCFNAWTGGFDGNTDYCNTYISPTCGKFSNYWVHCNEVAFYNSTVEE